MNRKRLDERRLHYGLIRRIYALCRSGKWRLRFANIYRNPHVSAQVRMMIADGACLWNAEGCVDPVRNMIYVDYRYDVLATLMHECLHILLGESYSAGQAKEEEREVRRLECLIMRNLSPMQAKRIHVEMATLLCNDANDVDQDDD